MGVSPGGFPNSTAIAHIVEFELDSIWPCLQHRLGDLVPQLVRILCNVVGRELASKGKGCLSRALGFEGWARAVSEDIETYTRGRSPCRVPKTRVLGHRLSVISRASLSRT